MRRWLAVLTAVPVTVLATAEHDATAKRVGRVRVPDVRYLTPERAYDVARGKGLRVAIGNPFGESTNTAAMVLEQSAKRGKRVRRGSILRLTVGIGGLGSPGSTVPTQQGTVPAAVGLRVPEATRRIRAQHLRWHVRFSALAPSRKPHLHDNYVVVAQNPAPGTTWDDQHPAVELEAGQ